MISIIYEYMKYKHHLLHAIKLYILFIAVYVSFFLAYIYNYMSRVTCCNNHPDC